MKKLLLISAVLLSSIAGFSQEPTVKAKIRCRTYASHSLPVDSVTQLVFTAKDLRKGKFHFTYKNALKDSDVKRSFDVQDKNGKQVYSAEGSSFKISSTRLRELLELSPLKLYSMAIPADPEKAKIVRVRPILVAELSLR
ncbi:MAG: hypothetical protein EOO09_20040 [Chitinophagaceae bacterium]|nr:MAG: hypothetical protein EOO09_20040 [Chitinophagaceae bacterium]